MNTSGKNCSISCQPKILSLWTFFAVKVNESDVNPGICVIVKTCGYTHTEMTDTGMTSLPSTLTTKKSIKMRCSAYKMYYNFSQKYPNM